ncbi:unnamed protein product [Amoebophrya sp. A120]|nr:unnamed protein product [Amoebophrya sp. A120]|eukprot:GSA120T00019120001.1
MLGAPTSTPLKEEPPVALFYIEGRSDNIQKALEGLARYRQCHIECVEITEHVFQQIRWSRMSNPPGFLAQVVSESGIAQALLLTQEGTRARRIQLKGTRDELDRAHKFIKKSLPEFTGPSEHASSGTSAAPAWVAAAPPAPQTGSYRGWNNGGHHHNQMHYNTGSAGANKAGQLVQYHQGAAPWSSSSSGTSTTTKQPTARSSSLSKVDDAGANKLLSSAASVPNNKPFSFPAPPPAVPTAAPSSWGNSEREHYWLSLTHTWSGHTARLSLYKNRSSPHRLSAAAARAAMNGGTASGSFYEQPGSSALYDRHNVAGAHENQYYDLRSSAPTTKDYPASKQQADPLPSKRNSSLPVPPPPPLRRQLRDQSFSSFADVEEYDPRQSSYADFAKKHSSCSYSSFASADSGPASAGYHEFVEGVSWHPTRGASQQSGTSAEQEAAEAAWKSTLGGGAVGPSSGTSGNNPNSGSTNENALWNNYWAPPGELHRHFEEIPEEDENDQTPAILYENTAENTPQNIHEIAAFNLQKATTGHLFPGVFAAAPPPPPIADGVELPPFDQLTPEEQDGIIREISGMQGVIPGTSEMFDTRLFRMLADVGSGRNKSSSGRLERQTSSQKNAKKEQQDTLQLLVSETGEAMSGTGAMIPAPPPDSVIPADHQLHQPELPLNALAVTDNESNSLQMASRTGSRNAHFHIPGDGTGTGTHRSFHTGGDSFYQSPEHAALLFDQTPTYQLDGAGAQLLGAGGPAGTASSANLSLDLSSLAALASTSYGQSLNSLNLGFPGAGGAIPGMTQLLPHPLAGAVQPVGLGPSSSAFVTPASTMLQHGMMFNNWAAAPGGVPPTVQPVGTAPGTEQQPFVPFFQSSHSLQRYSNAQFSWLEELLARYPSRAMLFLRGAEPSGDCLNAIVYLLLALPPFVKLVTGLWAAQSYAKLSGGAETNTSASAITALVKAFEYFTDTNPPACMDLKSVFADVLALWKAGQNEPTEEQDLGEDGQKSSQSSARTIVGPEERGLLAKKSDNGEENAEEEAMADTPSSATNMRFLSFLLDRLHQECGSCAHQGLAGAPQHQAPSSFLEQDLQATEHAIHSLFGVVCPSGRSFLGLNIFVPTMNHVTNRSFAVPFERLLRLEMGMGEEEEVLQAPAMLVASIHRENQGDRVAYGTYVQLPEQLGSAVRYDLCAVLVAEEEVDQVPAQQESITSGSKGQRSEDSAYDQVSDNSSQKANSHKRAKIEPGNSLVINRPSPKQAEAGDAPTRSTMAAHSCKSKISVSTTTGSQKTGGRCEFHISPGSSIGRERTGSGGNVSTGSSNQGVARYYHSQAGTTNNAPTGEHDQTTSSNNQTSNSNSTSAGTSFDGLSRAAHPLSMSVDTAFPRGTSSRVNDSTSVVVVRQNQHGNNHGSNASSDSGGETVDGRRDHNTSSSTSSVAASLDGTGSEGTAVSAPAVLDETHMKAGLMDADQELVNYLTLQNLFKVASDSNLAEGYGPARSGLFPFPEDDNPGDGMHCQMRSLSADQANSTGAHIASSFETTPEPEVRSETSEEHFAAFTTADCSQNVQMGKSPELNYSSAAKGARRGPGGSPGWVAQCEKNKREEEFLVDGNNGKRPASAADNITTSNTAGRGGFVLKMSSGFSSIRDRKGTVDTEFSAGDMTPSSAFPIPPAFSFRSVSSQSAEAASGSRDPFPDVSGAYLFRSVTDGAMPDENSAVAFWTAPSVEEQITARTGSAGAAFMTHAVAARSRKAAASSANANTGSGWNNSSTIEGGPQDSAPSTGMSSAHGPSSGQSASMSSSGQSSSSSCSQTGGGSKTTIKAGINDQDHEDQGRGGLTRKTIGNNASSTSTFSTTAGSQLTSRTPTGGSSQTLPSSCTGSSAATQRMSTGNLQNGSSVTTSGSNNSLAAHVIQENNKQSAHQATFHTSSSESSLFPVHEEMLPDSSSYAVYVSHGGLWFYCKDHVVRPTTIAEVLRRRDAVQALAYVHSTCGL